MQGPLDVIVTNTPLPVTVQSAPATPKVWTVTNVGVNSVFNIAAVLNSLEQQGETIFSLVNADTNNLIYVISYH